MTNVTSGPHSCPPATAERKTNQTQLTRQDSAERSLTVRRLTCSCMLARVRRGVRRFFSLVCRSILLRLLSSSASSSFGPGDTNSANPETQRPGQARTTEPCKGVHGQAGVDRTGIDRPTTTMSEMRQRLKAPNATRTASPLLDANSSKLDATR